MQIIHICAYVFKQKRKSLQHLLYPLYPKKNQQQIIKRNSRLSKKKKIIKYLLHPSSYDMKHKFVEFRVIDHYKIFHFLPITYAQVAKKSIGISMKWHKQHDKKAASKRNWKKGFEMVLLKIFNITRSKQARRCSKSKMNYKHLPGERD